MSRSGNQSPGFSERSSPRFSDPGTPRFTEHFNATPPYQQFLDSAENAPIPRYDSHGLPPGPRLSQKGRPLSPPAEWVSQDPQAYNPDSEEKQVVPSLAIAPSAQHTHTEDGRNRRRIYGLPLIWLLVLLGVIVALAVGLGVGLGVGLTKNKSTTSTGDVNSDAVIGGALNPAYYSTEGAFNGSGIALASQSFATDLEACTQGSIWIGGDTAIGPDDAKNGTALSAVAYSYGGVNSWHVFYIDQNNILKQRSNNNNTNVWVDGELNALNVTVLDADMVGMQACWYGNQYGDSDYTHSPDAPDTANATKAQEVGMHLWYAADNTTFQQLGWRAGDEVWTKQSTFSNMNGHAGVGCYSWGGGTTTYAMFVNINNTVEFYWKDTNTNKTSTKDHPINEWTNSSIAINNVYPSTSLGYTNAFYAQDATTLQFNGYNISWAAENTSFVPGGGFTVTGDPGLPGTHLSVSTIPSSSGGDDLIVFYQTNGSDVTEYTRDYVQGQWTSFDIPIPES